jgi:hypothetical protein
MPLLVAAILAGLVDAFLTQLLVHDRILDAPRNRVHRWLEAGGTVKRYILDLLSCHRCAGVWLAIPATFLVLNGWDGWRPFLIVMLSASMIQFLLAQMLDRIATHD